jgi:L-ascorbate metabolism protein UlaG (beta-lactamase superfamily)
MPLRITFLGHSGFILDDGSYRVAVDPFLTGNPMAPFGPDDVTCTHIAVTHGHSDHLGDTLAIAGANDATVIGAFEIATWAGENGIGKTEPGNPGGRIDLPFGWIAFTQAFHSSSYEGRYMGMPCGLVIAIGGEVLYHAGDTGLFSDMKLIGDLYRPTITALPIGDRFTMGPHLASRAAEMIGAPVAIPIHYRTFPPLVQSAEDFRPKGVTVREMAPGETWEVGA